MAPGWPRLLTGELKSLPVRCNTAGCRRFATVFGQPGFEGSRGWAPSHGGLYAPEVHKGTRFSNSGLTAIRAPIWLTYSCHLKQVKLARRKRCALMKVPYESHPELEIISR